MAKVNMRGLADAAAASRLIHPRDILAALPNKDPKFNYLRGPQDQVVDQWFEHRDRRDNVVKLNTGGGKTVVGLLIAVSCLNEGRGPVTYLVPDHYLAGQVRDEAASLGITVTDSPQQVSYQKGDAVLVDVFHRLFNGQSVFGVSTSAGRPPRFALGTVIVDDAHACLTTAESQFRVTIPRDAPAYDALLNLFADALDQQSAAGLLDLREGRPAAVQEVPYWAWADRQKHVLDVLHPISADKPHIFTWPLLVDVLPLCRAVFTAEALEVAAPCLPVNGIQGFVAAPRRIFLTATLADDGILVTDFDANPDEVADPIVPASAGDIGDRMILVPQQTHPEASDDEIRQLIVGLASDRNVVVIVPSAARADYWRSDAAMVLDKDSLHAGVEAMKNNPTIGLVVLVNRYDGIDLPGDACHVLVIDGLPEAIGGIERVDQARLAGSPTLLVRQIQRLEQGMGRATRSNEDHCAVILLGARLAERLYHPSAQAIFSPATREQLDLSNLVAEQLEGSNLDDLRDAIFQCLDREEDWVKASRLRLATVKYEPASVSDAAIRSRAAFDSAAVGDFRGAAVALEPLLGGPFDEAFKGCIRQQIAAYTHHANAAEAQQAQLAAYSQNRRLLRPVAGVAYEKLSTPVRDQAAVAATWLQTTYDSATELVLGFNALLADLQWGKRTDAFEQAWSELAPHLGFAGQRPELETGRGPDGLWALTTGVFHVVEAKSGVEGDKPVYKSEAEQLSNAMDWFANQYPGMTATPILIHPTNKFHHKAAVPRGCRVVTTKKLSDLRDAVLRLATALADTDAYRDPTRVGQALRANGFAAEDFVGRYTTGGRSAGS